MRRKTERGDTGEDDHGLGAADLHTQRRRRGQALTMASADRETEGGGEEDGGGAARRKEGIWLGHAEEKGLRFL